MRHHLASLLIACALCVGSIAAAEPVFQVEVLRGLSAKEERARGIANVPDTMTELARLRGISILAEPNSETANARLPIVKDALAQMPDSASGLFAQGDHSGRPGAQDAAGGSGIGPGGWAIHRSGRRFFCDTGPSGRGAGASAVGFGP